MTVRFRLALTVFLTGLATAIGVLAGKKDGQRQAKADGHRSPCATG